MSAAKDYDPNTAARPCSPANIGPAGSGKSESKRLVGSAGDGSQASGSPPAPSFMDQVRALQREQVLDFQWQLLVELTGSEECAATVVGRTPFMGVPRQAIDILERRGRSEDTP